MTEEILEEVMPMDDVAINEPEPIAPEKSPEEVSKEVISSFKESYPQIMDFVEFSVSKTGEVQFDITDFTKFNIPTALYNGDLFGDKDTTPYWYERKYLIQHIYGSVSKKCNKSKEWEIIEHKGYYRVIKSSEKEQILYNEMTEEEKAEYDKQKRIKAINSEILSYKAYISETDYIVTKINEVMAIGTEEEVQAVKEQYAEQLAKRKEAREKINELEEELKSLDSVLSEAESEVI